MRKRKLIFLSLGVLLLVAAVLDTIRYLKPNAEHKITVYPANTFMPSSGKKIILVYNANGGIYPGITDFIYKEVFPKSYPCNLCYQTFGTFRMKKEWRNFLDSLPYTKEELHKDDFKRNYKPNIVALPAILIYDGVSTQLLMSANEINSCSTLQQLKDGARENLLVMR